MKSFSLKARIRSFQFAADGIRYFFREEPHAWVHLIATVLTAGAAVYTRLWGYELTAIVIVTGLVWIAELFNTVVERIVDMLCPDYDRMAGLIKDMAAGAVLLAALTAIVTAAIVFIPKFI